MFDKLKVRRKLSKIGSKVDTTYMLYLNNDDPKSFASHGDVMRYVRDYRRDNDIFKLQIYRIDVYSL